MEKNKKLYVLKEMPVHRALITLSIPSILTSLVNTLHNIIDTMFISQLHNNAMIAATTVALPIAVLSQAIGDGIGVGSGSYVGRLLGAKEERKISQTVESAMTLTFIVSAVAFVLSLTILKPAISLFTDDLEVAAHTYDYLIILMTMSFFTISKQVLANMLRASGDVNFPMYTIIGSIFLNVLMNPIFMFDFGFGLKIKGAAIATILAEAIAAALMFYRITRKDCLIQWKFARFSLTVDSLKQIFNVGIPVFIRNGLSSMSYGFFARSAGLFGTDFVAASGLARKGEYFARFVIMGMAQGYQPFASYNYGARNKQRLMSAMKTAMGFGICYGLLMGSFFLFFPHVFLSILTSDASLIEAGKYILVGYAFAVPVVAVYQVCASNFQAMGKGKLSFFSSVLRQGIVYCPLVTLLPRVLGVTGMYIVQPLSDWLSAAIVLVLSKSIFSEIRSMEEQGSF